MTKFKVNVYKKTRRFSIPKKIRDKLGIGDRDSVHLIIRTLSGEKLFNGRKTLRSGPEIYGDGLSGLTPGSTVEVVASQPRLSGRSEAEAKDDGFRAQERTAGFPCDPETRRIVEEYAMERVRAHLLDQGFTSFDNTSKRECYDYTCARGGNLYYIEVKGTQGSGTSVILTKNEIEHAKKYPQRSITVIVHDVKVRLGGGPPHASGGALRVFHPWIPESTALEPIQFRWAVPPPLKSPKIDK